MSNTGIIIAGLCYLVTAVGYLRQRNYPMALVFTTYMVANIGFVWANLTKE